MTDRKVEKGQMYLSEVDHRAGITRIITIERTVLTKRACGAKKQLYAVGVSTIVNHQSRPELNGKKRRVFIKAKSLLSAQYALITVAEYLTGSGPCAPVPVPCGESTIVDGLETVPGL